MIISKNKKNFYTSYSKLSEAQLIKIGLASSKRIKQWAEKTLPNGKILGEVINANTLHHKTFKPQKGGLFCERIFGPLKDFECACGKPLKQKKKSLLNSSDETSLDISILDPNKTILGNPAIETRNFCNVCEVEYTWSVKRRYQLGYINLISPVTHVWYLKGNPSYLSILLDIKKSHLERVTYCSESWTIENALKGKTTPTNLSDIVSSWNKLKQQILNEKRLKFENEKINNSKNDTIQSKIQKRKNLKIKKQNYWKKFYFDPKLDNINTSKSALLLKLSNLDDATEMNKDSMNKFKQYFKNINIKTLFELNSMLQKIKQSQINIETNSPKQILKLMSIPFYVLFRVKQNYTISESSMIKEIWIVLAQKAIHQSLMKINKIFKKVDEPYMKKYGLKSKLNHMENFPNEIENLQLDSTIFLKFIKQSLFTLLNPISNFDKSESVLFFSGIKDSFKNKLELFKLEPYLIFYTLSNFSHKQNIFLLKKKFCYETLKSKYFQPSLEILLQNLSNIFFKIGLRKNEAILKKLIGLSEVYTNNKNTDYASLKLKKQKFKDLVELTYQFKAQYKESLFNFFDEKLQLKNLDILDQALELNTNSNLINLKKKDMLPKKIYNNFYCLSHRERWEGENDWNFLYYFLSSNFEEGSFISNYKNHQQTITSLTSNENDFDLNSSNLQKTVHFSGPGIIQRLLTEFNFYEIKKMDRQNRMLLYQLNKKIFKLKPKAKYDRLSKRSLKEAYKKRDLLIRRTKLIRKLFIKESNPEAMILTVLPVLPPDLRPIVKMGGQIAASDLNRLYQRVIYRNDRLKKFLKDPATSFSYEMKYAQRLLQEAVDNLIQNGKSGVVSEKDSRGRALKSLSDILKGKQGRFRQYLLGKRVDYSGRSVIVVGPKLKLHECGIPKEMAQELYLPFLLKRILNEKLAKTVVGAKTLIKNNPSLSWELLREIMQTCPVLLNRAPTLHRLGIQAFQPKLIEGRAILLHPLVCSAFNADFDGDQMAVHIPITVEARAEAWKLMLSRNNILSPATGEPLMIPSQDMVLGCYYLTTSLLNKKTQDFKYLKNSGFYYASIQDVLRDYYLKKIYLHSHIWLKWNHIIENGSDQEEPIEIRVDNFGHWREIFNKNQKTYNFKNKLSNQYILTTPGKILFNEIIEQCLKY